jgi:hypothetical protein
VTGGPGLLSSDAGKGIFAIQWAGADTAGGASCMTTASATTIATVTSSTTGTLSQNAIANCGTTNGNVGVLFYGHDDTAARALAKAATFDGNVCKLELVPGGLSLQTTGQWNTAACPGVGVGSTGSKYASVGGLAPGNISVLIIPPWFNTATCTGNAGGANNDCFGSAPASGFTNLSINGLGDTTLATSKTWMDTTNDAVYQNLIFELLGGGTGLGFRINNGNHGISNLIVDQFGGSSGAFYDQSNNSQVFEMFVGNVTSANGEAQVNNGVLSCYSCAIFPTGTGTGSSINLTGASVVNDYNGFYLNGSTNSSATIFVQNTSSYNGYGINASNTGNTGDIVIDVTGTARAYLMAGSRVQGGATGSIWAGCAAGTFCKDDGTNVETGTQTAAGAMVSGFTTAANCAVSSASPAACAGAASGSVAVPTAASTYTVNTTAVTANSQIIIQQDTTTTTGTRLGVTCNTTVSTALPLLTAKVAGTSFTFSLTAPATNPDCFSYTIVN